MRGFSPPHGTWVAICGTDLVRTNDGFMVLEDNLRVPSGVSYMLANRKVAKSSLRRLYRRSRVREVSGYGRMPSGDPARARAERAARSVYRAAYPRCLQRHFLRTHVFGPRTRARSSWKAGTSSSTTASSICVPQRG